MQNCSFGHKSHKTKVVNTKLGPMTVYDVDHYMDLPPGYCPGRDDISRTLINQQPWEKEVSARFESIVRNGNSVVVWDIGAQIGWFTRLAQNLGCVVAAIEGSQENLALLRENSNPGTIIIDTWFDENTEPLARSKMEKVIWDSPHPYAIELVKIDIEGAEQHAIRFLEPILQDVKNIIMEVSPVFNDSYPDLLKKLENEGFDIRELDDTPFDWNFDFAQRELWLERPA